MSGVDWLIAVVIFEIVACATAIAIVHVGAAAAALGPLLLHAPRAHGAAAVSGRAQLYGQVSRKWAHPRAAEGWKLAAACEGEDPETWFPKGEGERNGSKRVKAATAYAQAICADCPVKTDCLAFAIALDLRYGIWGGVTEQDRAKLVGRRRVDG
jgi:WhiB family redox-sensing transcriptional regulator